jgi:hypothetical protein
MALLAALAVRKATSITVLLAMKLTAPAVGNWVETNPIASLTERRSPLIDMVNVLADPDLWK